MTYSTSIKYFTEDKMEKLKGIGYSKEFYSLEEGARDYVKVLRG
jgi:ADP-L-glycero-D-manno-heptose 6-epimerase